jgi:hypothetical protein
MKRGPKPLGSKAMTAAERQARFRATHADGAPRIKYRTPIDRRSRAQRWQVAVADLVALQDDYRTWLNALPPNLEASATAEALRAICDLDLSDIQSVEPPRGLWSRLMQTELVTRPVLLRAERANARSVEQRVRPQASMLRASVGRCATPRLRARPPSDPNRQ